MSDANGRSAFTELGFKRTIEELTEEIQALYRVDAIPWVVGYSGGKDSTAVLQLVWNAVASLPPEHRHKPVHVISTDTLVENPIVASWVNRSLDIMQQVATSERLPVEPHRLTPQVNDTFWVNLIGKGYPAPRPKFRWCTERLKINPSNKFIRDVVRASGEAILVLGTRKVQSSSRHARMSKLEKSRVRDRLSPNDSLPNSLVFSPIEDWTNDDVWLYLMQVANPWGYENKDLLTLYQGASPDAECPLVVDTTTPSCGDSRFGCWVCTLVDKDKSMTAMIQNDDEKEWMLPLLELRNELDVADDRPLRDFRRMNGSVQLMGADDRTIPGPYTQASREQWLRKLLEAQTWIRANGPDHVANLELISTAELVAIRRIWVLDKHETEDSLPRIFQEVTGEVFAGPALGEHLAFGREELDLLEELAGDDRLHFELTRELLSVERRYRTMARRNGLFEALEKAFKRSYYDDADDAVEHALSVREAKARPAPETSVIVRPIKITDPENSDHAAV